VTTTTRIKSITETSMKEAASLLQAGELVVFPTETVYGIGADARNDLAVAHIFEVKGRPQFNPLIIHVLDLEQASSYAVFEDVATQIAEQFWPGPLTLVLPRRPHSNISRLASAGLNTVAVRAPRHPAARRLLELANCPVAAPSANLSGNLSPTNPHHVSKSLEDDVPLILDGGPCSVGVESTIIDCSVTPPSILRPGGIPVEQIEKKIGALGAPNLHTIRAPGMLINHYAPTTPIRLNARECQTGEGLLAFGPNPINGAKITKNLSQSGDLVEAAANLFAMLHTLDAASCTTIATMPIPDYGLGLAINDRLRRAAFEGK
jgi:L-threonylcarbamoyladenylate synthase